MLQIGSLLTFLAVRIPCELQSSVQALMYLYVDFVLHKFVLMLLASVDMVHLQSPVTAASRSFLLTM